MHLARVRASAMGKFRVRARVRIRASARVSIRDRVSDEGEGEREVRVRVSAPCVESPTMPKCTSPRSARGQMGSKTARVPCGVGHACVKGCRAGQGGRGRFL